MKNKINTRIFNRILAIIFIIFAFLVSKSGFFGCKIVSADGGCAEIVMEVNSNRVLHQLNSTTKKYMASTTKILTAIVIIENCNLNDIVTVKKQTVGIEGSSIYLKEGEKLSVKHLLYGLMLRSGNDCAETLAVFCSGSCEKFAELMNNTAKKIGANNSNFVNPHGLHDDNHYTTAFDLALISCYAMKNDDFRQIVGTKSIRIPNTVDNYERILVNKNKMLNGFEGANGIKTGFTKKAGRCLVSSCVRDGMELVCVVLNCPPMFERSKALINDTFNSYSNVKVLESDNILGFIELEKSTKKCAIAINKDIVLPLTEKEKNSIEIVYDYPKVIENSIKKGTEVGLVKIYCENSLIFEQKIYTIVDVK